MANRTTQYQIVVVYADVPQARTTQVQVLVVYDPNATPAITASAKLNAELKGQVEIEDPGIQAELDAELEGLVFVPPPGSECRLEAELEGTVTVNGDQLCEAVMQAELEGTVTGLLESTLEAVMECELQGEVLLAENPISRNCASGNGKIEETEKNFVW